MLDDKGELRLDAGCDEAVGRHDAAVAEKHVVQQHAGIRLVDVQGALHCLGCQADLVAAYHGSIGDFQIDEGFLHSIGVVEGHVRKLDRQLADLLAALFRGEQPPGGVSDGVVGQTHLEKSIFQSVGKVFNMLN